MKTPKEWVEELSASTLTWKEEYHAWDCCCERCSKGTVVLLQESDIVQIQLDALQWASSHILQATTEWASKRLEV